ncbi:MAG: redox-sensing transcriptional repressor Rex [Treponemataceae bacterium]
MTKPLGAPLPTIRRLPVYVRILKERHEAGDIWISSDALGRRLDLGAIQVRKDLSSVGAEGKAKHGFPIAETIRVLTEFLGTDDYAEVFLIGAGPLGAAVLADDNVVRHGFKIVAVFDPDRDLSGAEVFGFKVFPLSKMTDLVRRTGVKIAVLAVGPSALREATDVIAATELEGVFDLTGLAPELPKRMVVVREDFGSHLAALAGELGGKRRAER